MFHRPSDAVAFLTILAVCTAGAMHVSWWTALAGMCVLVLVSLNSNWPGRALGFGGTRVVADPIQLAASVMSASAISGAAFVLGRITGTVWGI